jgi:hypothetical protein
MMSITISEDQRLFVIPAGDGYTCAGFDYVFKQLKTLSQKLFKFNIDVGIVSDDEIGTKDQYHQYCAAISLIGNRDLGTWFDHDTPSRVRSILESYRRSGDSLRIFYGDRNTGRDWMEENDVVGRVGRSCGAMKIPLLISDGESGGPGILDACIVRICDVKSRQEIYRHPKYHQGVLDIRSADCGPPYTHGVWVDDSNHANFRSFGQAAQFVAFMTGHCMEQPQ